MPTFAFVGEAGNAILFVLTLVATTLVTISVVSYAGNCFLVVLQDTAAGIDRVQWPEEPTADWLLRSLRVTGLLALWLAPAGFLAAALRHDLLPDNGPLRFLLVCVPALWLFFPIGVLSAFSATTFWTPVRPAVLGKMLRVFPATLAFYLLSAAMGAGLAVLWYQGLFADRTGLLPVAAGATAAALLIYARLLGRVAWLIGRLPERKKAARAKAAAPKRRPRKVLKDRKAIHRATRSKDPWAAPKGELPVDAPNLPVEGYEVADDDAPRRNPTPKPKVKKFYEPPDPLEIERYDVDLSPPAPRPADETPLDGYDPVGLPQLPPQEAARLGGAVSEFEQRLNQPRPEEYVPPHPLWTGVWTFPWYDTSMKAWFTVSLSSLLLGVGIRALVQLYPWK